MRRVHGRDTAPEMKLRRALWRAGLRYRACPKDVLGKPDLVMASRRLAIFVDGDFWHGNQWRRRGLSSLVGQFHKTASRSYWVDKIERNMKRDCSVTARLLEQGWTVVRYWESDLLSNNFGACVRMVVNTAKVTPAPSPLAALPDKTVAEFFAGIGLMRMGLERKGWSIVFANDIDKDKHEMYRGHFGDTAGHFIIEDVHKLSADRVPSVALATASFPCNDLSLAGAREGLIGKQSSAFWGFTRILESMGERRPPLVLLENVTGFLTSRQGADFRDALLELNRLGYSTDAFILDAVWFVPQSRQRLFVVGVLGDGGPEVNPEGLAKDPVRPKALTDFITKHREISWKIRPLPPAPPSSRRLPDVLEDLPEDSPEWWSPRRVEYLLAQMSPKHREMAARMASDDEWSYGTVFRRMRNGKSMAELRVDGFAGCLRTPRGGSGRQILLKAGFGRYLARLITPREAARLMGANEFQIDVPLNQALFGFGDAVCVPAVEWIAENYLNPLVNELLRGRPLTLIHGRVKA